MRTMLFVFFELVDSFLLIKSLSLFAQYEGELLYFRISGIPILLLTVGIWWCQDFLGFNLCLLISVFSALWLFVTLCLREVWSDRHSKSER